MNSHKLSWLQYILHNVKVGVVTQHVFVAHLEGDNTVYRCGGSWRADSVCHLTCRAVHCVID